MSEFNREDRYIVIKRSDIDKAPAVVRGEFLKHCRRLHDAILSAGTPARSFVVVEQDWPEYEPVWRMIERRMNGEPCELAALQEELAKANEKIDQAWNRSHALDHKGFIPGALDAWKQPVPQHLPYDFSGNPGASATQYCNGWNDAGGYWSGHASDLRQRLTAAEQRNASMAELLSLVADDGELFPIRQRYWLRIQRALKPTESGASE